MKKIQDEIIKNNKHVTNNVDLQELIKNKLFENACLLDDFLLSRLPNGDPTPDEIVNEEITLLCFTVSFLNLSFSYSQIVRLIIFPNRGH